jgi:hypothetical protein
MAYYSEELHPEVSIRAPATSKRRGKGSAGSDAETEQVATVEERAADYLVDRFMTYHTQLAAEAVAPAATQEPLGEVLGRRRTTTTLPAVELALHEDYRAFVRDVMKYFGLGHRETVNKKLTDVLNAIPCGAPIVLISHSLGTVVSYDVLIEGRHHIDTWVTLGSPLDWVQTLQAQLPDWLMDMKPEHLVRLTGAATRVEEAAALVSEKVNGARDGIQSFFARFAGRRKIYELPRPVFPISNLERWFNIYDPSDQVVAPLSSVMQR